jgi:hypothetical protein
MNLKINWNDFKNAMLFCACLLVFPAIIALLVVIVKFGIITFFIMFDLFFAFVAYQFIKKGLPRKTK